MKGFYTEFALQGSFVAILLTRMKLVVLAKWGFKWPLHQEDIFFFYLDHVKFSLGIFVILSCLMKCLLYHLYFQDICIFCQKQTPKSCKLSVATNFSCENPILDTRIFSIRLRPPSRSGEPPDFWTGELWLKTNLLNWQNYEKSIFFANKNVSGQCRKLSLLDVFWMLTV